MELTKIRGGFNEKARTTWSHPIPPKEFDIRISFRYCFHSERPHYA